MGGLSWGFAAGRLSRVGWVEFLHVLCALALCSVVLNQSIFVDSLDVSYSSLYSDLFSFFLRGLQFSVWWKMLVGRFDLIY